MVFTSGAAAKENSLFGLSSHWNELGSSLLLPSPSLFLLVTGEEAGCRGKVEDCNDPGGERSYPGEEGSDPGDEVKGMAED